MTCIFYGDPVTVLANDVRGQLLLLLPEDEGRRKGCVCICGQSYHTTCM